MNVMYHIVFVWMIEEKSSWNSLYINADKLASEIFVYHIVHIEDKS